ncbi:hypothetical protein FS749_007731 [Ceratobasidium sp. UAMH 11750]|nr:hypothetical protein FS749_007731 [Ceratobasidium sp. UAMH 11750]
MIKKEHPERPKDYIPDGCEHGDVLWDALTRCWVYDPKGRSGATEVRDLMQGVKREGLVQNQSRRGVPP